VSQDSKAGNKKNGSGASHGGPAFLEFQEIRRLIRMCAQSGALELELEHLGAKLKIRMPEPGKQTEIVQVPSPYPVGQAFVPPAGQAPAGPALGQEGGKPEASGLPENTVTIESPMVGTFYRAPSPDADAFTKVGDTVDPEKVVCIIEAMKVMNEIKAETSGTILKILVENGEPVEYGQPLFLVKP